MTHGRSYAYNRGCRCDACSLARAVRYQVYENPRPHRWRILATETYRLARIGWEQRFEQETYVTWSPELPRRGEVADFLAANPAPTFRRTLEQLRG